MSFDSRGHRSKLDDAARGDIKIHFAVLADAAAELLRGKWILHILAWPSVKFINGL